MICAKASAVTSRTIKAQPKSAAEFTQFLQVNDLGSESTHQSPMVAHVLIMEKKRPRKTSNFEIVLVGLFRPYHCRKGLLK